ncbi:MAG: hypothetical protein KAY37_11260 [Phycisphaerae bacterium]|nr:hypothetical protein [Phycisphaerae bacterium]
MGIVSGIVLFVRTLLSNRAAIAADGIFGMHSVQSPLAKYDCWKDRHAAGRDPCSPLYLLT